MKAILRICSVLLLVLVTVQCDVKNETPVPQNIEPNIESTGRVDYVNIIKPYVYKDNVYFIDLGKTGKMTFINDHQVVFSGDFTITTGNKKLRIAADEPLADGALVYVRDNDKSGQLPPISLELSNGTKESSVVSINIIVKYDFYVIDPNFAALSGKVAHKEVFEFNLNGNYSKQIKEIDKYNGSISIQGEAELEIIYTIETIEEVENGVVKTGKKIETTSYDGVLSGIINANLQTNQTREEVERSLIEEPLFSQELGPFFVPGTIITLHPRLEIGFGIKSSVDISGTIDIIKGKKTDIVYYELTKEGYVEKGTTKQNTQYELMKFKDDVSFGLKAESSIGIYTTIDTKFNKYLIPLTDTEIALGGYKLTAFWNLKLAYDSSEEECSDRLNLTPNVECFFNFYAGTIYNKKTKKGESLANAPVFLDKLSFSLSPYNLSNLICESVKEEKLNTNLLSFDDFQKFVKNKNFEIINGQIPENINGSYSFNPNILGASNFEQDGVPTIENIVTDNRVKPFGKVIIDINDNGKSLSLYQYDLISGKLIAQESSFFENKDILGIKPVVYISQNGFSILCAINGEALTSGEKIEYLDFLALTYFKNNSKASGILKYRVQNIKGQFQKLPVDIYRVFVSNTVTKSNI